jgi:hypothetical protein
MPIYDLKNLSASGSIYSGSGVNTVVPVLELAEFFKKKILDKI